LGSLPFEISHKLGKTHQNVLISVKGNPRRATEKVGPASKFIAMNMEDASFCVANAPNVFSGRRKPGLAVVDNLTIASQ
jgi:hypothetical protein